ncbi:hypothetical protein EV714DRAFT_170792, partial [Schizophyllum commune]
YEARYDADEFGEELGANARVWRVLLDEGHAYDRNTVRNWRDTVDVYLVFTGLFSAVVTTLVVQFSQSLQPDHAAMNTILLQELIAVQRALAKGSDVDSVPSPTLAGDSVTASALVYWGNRFWYISLALSLLAAFISVLIRQWLHEYEKAVPGQAKSRVLVWQYRLLGMQRWKVHVIVALLPFLLHLSLFMFFVGLVIFVLDFDRPMAWTLAAFTAFFSALYTLSNMLPAAYPDCPYRTPLSDYGYWVVLAVSTWIRRSRLTPDLRTSAAPPTPQDRERGAVEHKKEDLVRKNFAWALSASSNPSVIRITVNAIIGLLFNPKEAHANESSLDIVESFQRALDSEGGALDWVRGQEDALERQARSLLLFADRSKRDDHAYRAYVKRVLQAVIQALTRNNDLPNVTRLRLEAAALALSSQLRQPAKELARLSPSLFPSPSPFLSAVGLPPQSALTAFDASQPLRLHSIIWYHMLETLTRSSSHFTSIESLRLTLAIWHSL